MTTGVRNICANKCDGRKMMRHMIGGCRWFNEIHNRKFYHKDKGKSLEMSLVVVARPCWVMNTHAS